MFPTVQSGARSLVKRSHHAILLAILLVILAIGAAHADPAAPGSIAGTVRNADGEPLPGIVVRVLAVDSAYASLLVRILITGPDGSYRAAVLPAGIYRIVYIDPGQVYARQYYPQARMPQEAIDIVVAGKDITGIDTTLVKAGSIAGTATDKGAPHPAMPISVYAAAGSSWTTVAYTTTTTAGTYQVDNLRPGIYRVCTESWSSLIPPGESVASPLLLFNRITSCYDAISAGVASATDVVVVSNQTTSGIDLRQGEEIDLASLRGKITDLDGAPLEDIVVKIDSRASDAIVSREAQTDAQGDYAATNIPPGTYQVHFTDRVGFSVSEYYTDSISFGNALPLKLTAAENRTGVDAALATGGRISGTVSLLGEAVPNFAWVTAVVVNGDPFLPKSFGSVTPDPITGAYTLAGLPPGIYRIAVSAYDIPNAFDSVYYVGANSVTTDVTQATNFTLTANVTVHHVDFVLGNGRYDGYIAGNVTGDNGPAVGIRVALHRAPYFFFDANLPLVYTFTDDAGAYRIDGLLEGEYYVRFSDPAATFGAMYYPRAASLADASLVQVERGTPMPVVDAQLLRAGGISGSVIQADGSRLSNAKVRVYNESSGSWYFQYQAETKTDDNGRYRFQGLLPGRYFACVEWLNGTKCYGDLSPHDDALALSVEVVTGKEAMDVDISFMPPIPVYLPIVGKQ